MRITVWLLLALLPMITVQQRVRKKGVLPPGPIPQACCQVFCPPKDICVCCFVDYEYFDGMKRVTANGVPDFLKPKTKREAGIESLDFDAEIDMDS
ncbi:hypothetical protein PENTCL1PPCAC_13361 [Pristionchus entomophagus]|uniref:Uncharacterized protein n=1 Tax=Pristionchus entomophagus TaxID=358040 RepID=A0AAV5T6P3_9BILA|nr:hypothetical protein PENTCL1PPCAC_13361 [Pristionchus entomophagus]